MSLKEFRSRNQGRKAKREIAEVAEAYGVDPRAVHTLYSAYYNLDRSDPVWPDDRVEPPAEDATLAKEAGLLHDPVEMSHDDAVKRLVAARDGVGRERVANAFIAGLSHSLFTLDSSLASYAVMQHATAHAFDEYQGEAKWQQGECVRCGLKSTQVVDIDKINLQRIRIRGGGGSPAWTYAMVDLEQIARSGPVKPTSEQQKNFSDILDAIRALPEKARTGELIKATTPFIKGDKIRRGKLVETLGWCGILKPAVVDWSPDEPMERRDLQEMGVRVNREMQFPVHGWCGADGVHEEAVAYWFPGMEGSSRPKAGHVAATKEKATKKKQKKERKEKQEKEAPVVRIESNRWPNVGDMFAVPLENGRWGACRVINAFDDVDPSGVLLGPCFYVAATRWVGKKLPSGKEPELGEIMRRDHHSWKGKPEILCVQYPPPPYYPHIGVRKPTPAEKRLRSSTFGDWEFSRQIYLQWRWENEREQVQKEDSDRGRSRREDDARIANWESLSDKLSKTPVDKFRRKRHLSAWKGRVADDAVRDVRVAFDEMMDTLAALGKNPPKRQLTKPLRDFADRVMQLDREHDYFLYSPERDEVADLLRQVSAVIGLGWDGPEVRRVLMRMHRLSVNADNISAGDKFQVR